MFRITVLAGALLCLLIVPASAKPISSHAGNGLHPRCNIDWSCAGSIISSSSYEASKFIVTRRQARLAARGRYLEERMPLGKALGPGESAAQFIRGRLVCARNIGAELARRGIQGTGSALAKSYLHWGRPSGPQPGAVAVFSRGKRGGHVAIVSEVKADGTVIYLNPSSRRQAWHVGPYHKRPIAYRVAG